MKKILLTCFGLSMVLLTLAQQLVFNSPVTTSLPGPGPAVFSWEATTHDFGAVKQNTPVTHEFTFTNTGDVPLIISSVQASCGCTVTSFTKDPIEPGGQGFVTATYNAAKAGQFTKTVTVNSNAEQVILTVKGEVVGSI